MDCEERVCCEQGDRGGEGRGGRRGTALTDGIRYTDFQLGNLKVKRLLDKHRRIWEDDIETNLKGRAYECTAVIWLRIGIRSGLL